MDKELIDKDIEWEKIENPDFGGPYWQPVNPYARFFWKELIESILAHKADKEYNRTTHEQLMEYFKERLSD